MSTEIKIKAQDLKFGDKVMYRCPFNKYDNYTYVESVESGASPSIIWVKFDEFTNPKTLLRNDEVLKVIE